MKQDNWREIQSQEELEEYLNNTVNLRNFSAVGKCKSVLRAIKRGRVSKFGTEYPKRPFNNSKRTKGRQAEKLKEEIYEQLKQGRF